MEREEMKRIQKEMEKRLGDDWDIQPVTVNKVGGQREGLSCRYQEENMAVTVYPESCKVTLGEKAGEEEIGEYLAGIVEENRRPPIEVSRTAEDFRNGLYIQMINADVNRELLKDAVYYQKEDMAAIARCRAGQEGGDVYSFLVTKENLSAFQMTEGEVLERAYRNTARQEFSLMSMEDIMREMFSAMASAPEDVEALERMIKENPSPLYILTNEERLNGANALVCPQVLQDAYETLGEPYYVLPSSTHEVLLVKESEGFSPEELRNMVSEVNISTVSPEDLLSFKIFRYDGRTLSAVKEETQTMTEATRKAKEHGFKLI